MISNIPMLLTWIRILMIPFVVGVYFIPDTMLSLPHKNYFAGVFFILAALTDALDGYLARRLNQTSSFGAFLDPVADKLMVGAALIMLVYLDRIGPVLALIIIGREITISALREWMAQIGAQSSIAVNSLGKLKTGAQMVAIPMLLFYETWLGVNQPIVGYILLIVAALLTVLSMLYYLKKAIPIIQQR